MDLQFSPSQLYFEKQTNLLQKIWFFSPLNIDLHVKYSFQIIEEHYFIQGAEIEGFNTEHAVQEEAMVYKIWLANPKFDDIKSLFIDLRDVNARIKGGIWNSVKNFPFRQRGIFLLLMILLPKTIGSFLLRINLIGIALIFLYTIYKTVKYFLKTFQKNKTSYQGYSVNYAEQQDAVFLTDEMLSALIDVQTMKISKIAYTGNCLYCYQEIRENPENVSEMLTSLVKKDGVLTEVEKAELVQQTLQYFQTSKFLSLIMKEHD